MLFWGLTWQISDCPANKILAAEIGTQRNCFHFVTHWTLLHQASPTSVCLFSLACKNYCRSTTTPSHCTLNPHQPITLISLSPSKYHHKPRESIIIIDLKLSADQALHSPTKFNNYWSSDRVVYVHVVLVRCESTWSLCLQPVCPLCFTPTQPDYCLLGQFPMWPAHQLSTYKRS